jgi:hypothetical protein
VVAADDVWTDPASTRPSVAATGPTHGADTDSSLSAFHIGHPSRPGALPALYVGLAGLQAFDAYSTIVGVNRGAVESNGLMKSIAGNPAPVIAVKGGVTAASILVAERLWKKHRRVAAIVTMVATNGLMAAVAAHNASVLRAQR